jgi:hypothetical protein
MKQINSEELCLIEGLRKKEKETSLKEVILKREREPGCSLPSRNAGLR